MTDRGLPIVDGAPACPFVAFEDERDERSTRPDHRHRCFAEARPAPRALAHQDAYCLSPSFPACPTFQDWARREAAVPRAPLRSDPEEAARPTVRRGRRDWAAPPPWLGPEDSRPEASRPGEPHARELPGDREENDEPAEEGERRVGKGAAAAAELGFLTPAAGAVPLESRRGSTRTAEEPVPAARSRGDVAAGGLAAGGLAATAAAWLGSEVAGPEVDEEIAEDLRPTAAAGRIPRRTVADAEGRWKPPAEPRSRTPSARRDDAPTVHGPEWEEPYRREAYPTLRTRVAMPSLSRVTLGFIALVAAAIVLFFLPPMLLKLGAGGDASPTDTPAPSVAASESAAPTPVPQPTATVYTVKSGDTLSGLAARYKVTVPEILAANPQIKNQNVLAIGDTLTIPTPASNTVPDATTVPDVTTVPAASASAP